MNPKSLKSSAFGVLVIFLLCWLYLVGVPLMRKDNEAIDGADKAIKESKQTIEKTKLEMERIEKSTPRIPRVPAENERVI